MDPIDAPAEQCSHLWAFDFDRTEAFCERCGISFPVFERKELAYAGGRKLTSPSVADQNLGSNQDDVIKDLRHGSTDPATGKRTYMLSGALRFFGGNGHSKDEDLVVELSNRLHGRVSDSDLAAVAQVFRKALRALDEEKRQKATILLNQMTGVSNE